MIAWIGPGIAMSGSLPAVYDAAMSLNGLCWGLVEFNSFCGFGCVFLGLAMCGLQWIDAEKPCGEMTAKGGVNGYGHTLGCYHLWTSAILVMVLCLLVYNNWFYECIDVDFVALLLLGLVSTIFGGFSAIFAVIWMILVFSFDFTEYQAMKMSLAGERMFFDVW